MNIIQNVVIVCDHAYISGGAAKIAITEAIGLAQNGLNVLFFSAVGPVDKKLENAGVKVICLMQDELKTKIKTQKGKILGGIQGLWNVKAKNELDKILRNFQNKNTVVHFHAWSLALSASVFSITAERKFKILITCHDYELNCPIRIYYSCNKKALCKHKAMSLRCIFTNCDKRSYIQKIYRVIRQKVLISLLKKNNLSLIFLNELNKKIMQKDFKVNYNGFIIQNPVEIHKQVNINPQNNDKYIFVGRLNPEKGVELFCEAVTQAGVKAEVIGDGDIILEMKEKYPNIIFRGWLSLSDMRPYIEKARCLILTSCWIETGPLTVLEMQGTYKLPCIIPSLCGIHDDIVAYKSGLVYEIGNLDMLIKRINDSKSDRVIEQLSNNCSLINIEKYSEYTHVKKLIDVYESVLKGEK